MKNKNNIIEDAVCHQKSSMNLGLHFIALILLFTGWSMLMVAEDTNII